MKNDLEEMEAELLNDRYNEKVRSKTDRKMIVSNLLESREQAKISKLGGAMFT